MAVKFFNWEGDALVSDAVGERAWLFRDGSGVRKGPGLWDNPSMANSGVFPSTWAARFPAAAGALGELGPEFVAALADAAAEEAALARLDAMLARSA